MSEQKVGTASYPSPRLDPSNPSLLVVLKRERALRIASARLANLHPHEWKVLVEAALAEEGLTD